MRLSKHENHFFRSLLRVFPAPAVVCGLDLGTEDL